MKSLTPQLLDTIHNTRGSELIVILGIAWNGVEILYSDQKIEGKDYPYTNIVEISDFDTTQTIDTINESQTLSVVLDDTDGKIKEIIENHNIQKQPVSVYFLFKGLSLEHKALFFIGEIGGDIIWDEGDRTLSFDVLSNRDSIDVGFAMEEGDFPSIPEEALGQVWPLVFGQVCNMPAVRVRSPRRGILLQSEGIHDFTITPRLCQARYITCPAETKKEVTDYVQPGQFEIGGRFVFAEEKQFESTIYLGPELSCVSRRFNVICDLLAKQAQQASYEHNTLNIRNGEAFPQDQLVTINIDGAIFTGSFAGTTFTVKTRKHPEYDEWDHQACRYIGDRTHGLKRHNGSTKGWTKTANGMAYRYTGTPINSNSCASQVETSFETINGPDASWEAYNDMESAGFHWIPTGSEVVLEDEAELLYIVSLLPGVVDKVAAYYTMPSGRKLLMEVPTEYYTVYNTNYTGYTVVEIGLEKELSLFDKNWDDELYISFTSSVGPNVTDIITWLIEKYTDYTVDPVSFAEVNGYLGNYPCNFWLDRKKNVFDLIQDIAYQSRCGIYIRGDTVYIKYLSKEPVSLRTLTKSDIVSNSLKIKLNDNNDIKTKHTIKWKKSGATVEAGNDLELTLVLKHNTERYGSKEANYDYYTQNTYSTILKSSTFWLIRESNSWKTIEFSTSLSNLDLDIWDCVTINTDFINSKLVITKININWNENTINFEGWTPIKAGKTEPYLWAWPADQNALETFPRPDDESQGAGYAFDITPPVGHLLLGGGEATTNIISSGDRNPSDLDDVYPVVYCETSDLVDLNDVEEPKEVSFNAKLAQDKARTDMDKTDEAYANVHMEKPEEDEQREYEKSCCTYSFTMTWITPTLITTGGPQRCGGPCSSSGCGPGVCNGDIKTYKYTFGSRFSAEIAKQRRDEGCTNHCPNQGDYCVGTPRQYGCPSRITTYKQPGDWCEDESCEDSSGEPDPTKDGEIYAPKDVT